MAKLVYLTLEQAIETHDRTIEVSGGGVLGQLDVGSLDGVLAHIKNDDYYPLFSDKLAHLFYCACTFHCFQDGNKRIAITLCTQMLLLNGYLYCSGSFIQNRENISYHVASGKISADLLNEIIAALLDEDLESERIKFKIFDAIAC